MRYTHMFTELPSPSATGRIANINKAGVKAKPAINLTLQPPSPLHKVPSRLPTSQRHRIRKASISTGQSTTSSKGSSSLERRPSEAKKLKAMPEQEEVVVPTASPREMKTASKMGLCPSTTASPRLKAWEAYLHWLCLTEEPGTLWSSSLCATFHECLVSTAPAAECAARVDDIYWSFYLPLDPLLQFMEDRILSGYLLHVWTIFVELGKRIPHDDPAQDKLVELLKELVHLPPMEVRTWEGNNAPWSDLPTLDDALVSGWDDLYDPEIQMTDPEAHWVNYFSFLGRLVAAEVTPDWWEIPAVTLRDVLAEDVTPTSLTRCKTMALAEFMNRAGDAFFDWTIDSGLLNVERDMSMIAPLIQDPVRNDWFEKR